MSESSGTAKIRFSCAKPQSSSSHKLNARALAKVVSGSSRSACSQVTPKVGKSSAHSTPCSSITASRAARS